MKYSKYKNNIHTKQHRGTKEREEQTTAQSQRGKRRKKKKTNW
jgi:hypothetical protein